MAHVLASYRLAKYIVRDIIATLLDNPVSVSPPLETEDRISSHGLIVLVVAHWGMHLTMQHILPPKGFLSKLMYMLSLGTAMGITGTALVDLEPQLFTLRPYKDCPILTLTETRMFDHFIPDYQ